MEPFLPFLSFFALSFSSPFESSGFSVELRAVLDSALDPSSVETLGDESRLPRPGMDGMIEEVDPWRLVVKESLRARRWKFWDEIRLRLGSFSGSGVPVRDGGELIPVPKVTLGPDDSTGSAGV